MLSRSSLRALFTGVLAAGFASAPAVAQVQPGTPAAPPAPLPVASPSPSAPASPVPAGSGEPSPSPTPTPVTGRRLAAFTVTAKRIAFYSNRYVMTADGHVAFTLGDGTRITGNTYSYDLRLNRALIAGNVTLTAAHRTLRGAAFAEYFDFDRAYFIPILSQPDRWTFVAGDYAHPLFGRENPGDTFFLPDLSGERVFLYASKALVDPKQSVRFTPADINFGLTFVTFPTYFLSYATNPYFAQNALRGAFVDGPLDFAGGEHSLATAHIRYDQADGVYPAAEVHEVSNDSYAVASINPITRPLKVYTLQLYDRITPGLQFQSQIMETAFQSGFSQPLSATAFADMRLTAALPHSFIELIDDQYYDSLLAQPKKYILSAGGAPIYYYGDPSHNWVPDHPNDLTLEWIGHRNQIGRSPFFLQLRSDAGAAKDSNSGLQELGGVTVDASYFKGAGFNLSTKSLVVLKDKSGHHDDLFFTALYDRQRQWYSVPHFIDTQTVGGSLTKVVNTHLNFLLNYTNTNTGDFYGAQQSLAYPPNATYYNPFTGQSLTESPGFRGFGTTRSFREQVVFAPSPALTFNATMRENYDFPRPIPDGLQIVGDGVGFVNYGLTPLEADLDVRFRISRVLLIDVERSYYFGFAGYERWAPQFNIQVEQ